MASRTIKVVIQMRGAKKAQKETKEIASSVKKVAKEEKKAKATADKLAKARDRLANKTKKLNFIQKRLTASYIAGNLAARAISTGVQHLTNAVVFGISSAIDFEFSMAKISAISNVAGESLMSLETTIRDIAKVSPKTSTEVAQAALEMSKMGLAGQDLEDSLQGVVNLSVALDEEVRTVGQTMVSVKNVFNKDASELTDIADQMFTILGNSALNLEKFSTAFSFAGASARMAGVSFEELSALMGTLADNGIKASTIGTQLRQIFTRLDNPLSKVSKLIGANSLRTRGLSETMALLNEVIQDSGDSYNLFGLRSTAVVDILTRNIDKTEELTKKTEDMEKSTKKAAKELLTTMGGALAALTSGFSNLNIEISKSYKPSVIKGLALLAGVFNKMTSAWVKFSKLDDAVTGFVLGKLFTKSQGAPSSERVQELKELKQLSEDVLNGEKNSPFGVPDGQSNPQDDFLQKLLAPMIAADNAAKIKAETDAINEEKKALDARNKAIADGIAIRKKMDQDKTSKASAAAQKIKDKIQQDIEKLEIEREKRIDKMENARIRAEAKIQKLVEQESSLSGDKFVKELQAQKEINAELERTKSFKSELHFLLQEEVETLTLRAEAISFTNHAIDAFSQSLANAIVNFQSFGDIAKAFFKQMLVDLAAMIIKAITLRAILALTGGGGGLGTVVPDSIFPVGIGAAAKGFNGTVDQPTMMLVGESGPENVMVTPRAKSGVSNSGGNVVVNISGDVYGEEQFLERLRLGQEELDRRTV